MRKHNGMRPQDIVILLKILVKGKSSWQMKEVAQELFISQSEVTESLNRSALARLISTDRKILYRQTLYDFLKAGISHVFPTAPGKFLRGIPTAHSHPTIKKVFHSDQQYVWPDPMGTETGFMIEPFYKEVINAVKKDEDLYFLLALVDILRVGRVREIKYSLEQLKTIIGP